VNSLSSHCESPVTAVVSVNSVGSPDPSPRSACDLREVLRRCTRRVLRARKR